jgi:hypothetical protein
MKRMKALDSENLKLKKMLADRMLESHVAMLGQRLLALGATLVFAGACSHTQSTNEDVVLPPPSEHVVLVWKASGWTTLTIRASGAAHYDFTPHGWGSNGVPARHEDGAFKREELTTLVDTLAAHHACSLRSSGRLPVPDEQSSDLTLDLPGMQCTVSMLDNEWSDAGDNVACGTALKAAALRIAPP